MSPEQELRALLVELAELRAEMKQFRALLKGDAVALETLLKVAREQTELNGRWQ